MIASAPQTVVSASLSSTWQSQSRVPRQNDKGAFHWQRPSQTTSRCAQIPVHPMPATLSSAKACVTDGVPVGSCRGTGHGERQRQLIPPAVSRWPRQWQAEAISPTRSHPWPGLSQSTVNPHRVMSLYLTHLRVPGSGRRDAVVLGLGYLSVEMNQKMALKTGE